MQLTFHGDSDDTCLIFSDGEPICDFSGWYDMDGRLSIDILRKGEGFRATYHYNGFWSISIEPLGDDIPIPDWLKLVDVKLDVNGYSADLTVDVPDDVQFEESYVEGEEDDF